MCEGGPDRKEKLLSPSPLSSSPLSSPPRVWLGSLALAWLGLAWLMDSYSGPRKSSGKYDFMKFHSFLHLNIGKYGSRHEKHDSDN